MQEVAGEIDIFTSAAGNYDFTVEYMEKVTWQVQGHLQSQVPSGEWTHLWQVEVLETSSLVASLRKPTSELTAQREDVTWQLLRPHALPQGCPFRLAGVPLQSNAQEWAPTYPQEEA